MSASIPATLQEGGYTVYRIHTQLPLRVLRSERRFSEFVALARTLPAAPALPPKTSLFGNKNDAAVVAARRVALAQWLNQVLADPACHTPQLRQFLNVPAQVELASRPGVPPPAAAALALSAPAPAAVSPDEWLVRFRDLKELVGAARGALLVEQRRLVLVARSQARALDEALQAHASAVPASEHTRRQQLLGGVLRELAGLDSPTTTPQPAGRSWGGPPAETATTLPLSNQQLLVSHKDTMAAQDAEVEQLRQVVQRQKGIAEAIHQEVRQQDELLDELELGLEASERKLRYARNKVGKMV